VEVSRVAWRFNSHMIGKPLIKMLRIPVTDFCVTMFAAKDASANNVICTDSPRGQGISSGITSTEPG
jgi:hypothetical protein